MRQADERHAGRARARTALAASTCLTTFTTTPACAASLTPELAAGLALFGGVALAAAGFAAAYLHRARRSAQRERDFTLRLDADASALENEMRDEQRPFQWQRWAGVKLVVEALPERVFFQFGDGESRMHGYGWGGGWPEGSGG